MSKLIKYVIIAILGFSGTPFAKAGTLDQRADSAYSADNFELAAELYRQEMTEHGTSATLYYNLGNCYYRMGLTGKAIVAYERALRINPADKSAKTNLQFVNSRIFDRQGERGSFMSNSFDKAATLTSSNTYAWLALSLFLICIGCITLYIFSTNIGIRKCGFFGAILMLDRKSVV